MTLLKYPLALAVFGSLSLAAQADTVTISQKGRQFSSATLNLHKGDTVVFNNDDTVPHNATSKSEGNEFDLGYQAPGASTPVSFDKAGDVVVVCTIHPKMKMTIHVSE